jgi:cyanophycin synthetase
MSRIDGFEARLRALFPAIGVLQPQGGETDLSLAHVLQRPRWPCRLRPVAR